VTGKVGAAGRASNEHFASLVERDAFIAKRIERALRDGFVEGTPSDEPAPEPSEPEEGRGAEGLEKHRGTELGLRVCRMRRSNIHLATMTRGRSKGTTMTVKSDCNSDAALLNAAISSQYSATSSQLQTTGSGGHIYILTLNRVP
jgi:hypothetical protein